MDLRQVVTIYLHEVRSALRERSIVIYSIVLPVVLYPTILWAMFAGLSFIRGQSERLASRVAMASIPPAHQELVDKLKANKKVSFTHWSEGREAAIQSIADGDLDVLMEFTAAPADSADLKDNFKVLLSFNQARDRSSTAKERVEKVLSSYRHDWLDRERKRLGVSDRDWNGFRIQMENIASRKDSGRFVLSLMAPMLIILIVGLAAFYPAIDATAGERERSTWETLMTVAAPRSTIALAKYLYVSTFGLAGGLLNLAALALSTQWLLRSLAGSAADKLFSTGIPWSGLPVIAIGTVLVALFVAAIMLVLAAFARNFKEGQSMITPFYMVLLIPVLFLQSPDLEFTVQLAMIPVANVMLLIRDAIMGSYALPQIALTFASMGLFAGLSIAFAQWVMKNEDVFVGTHEGGLWRFLKRRLKRRGADA